jgi:hypothetical protein
MDSQQQESEGGQQQLSNPDLVPEEANPMLEGSEQPIDLDSDDVTFNQAKRIRQQVERDVELLRNRVRMLQLEEEKAHKKIMDTKKKTKQINDLKTKNDQKYETYLNA